MKIKKQKKGFTLSEVMIVLVLMGIVVTLYSVGIKLYNPTQKGFDVQSQKTLGNIDQVFNMIFAKHSESFDLTDLNDANGAFSITDSNINERFSGFFKEYLNVIDLKDINKTKTDEYYKSEIIDYNRTSTGVKLKDTYSNFITTANGTIFGFRLYQSCSAEEKNSNPPLARGRKTVQNICGSIFFDVNNYDGPNKLGSDQYIIPFNSQGTEIKN